MSRSRAAVILAAGKGTRMKSERSKVLHEVGGRSMLDWSLDLAGASGCSERVVVYGGHAPDVAARAEAAGAKTALQDPPLGTAHAVLAARDALDGFTGDVVVLYADTPLIQPDTISAVFDALADGAGVAVLGFEAQQPGAYGRLVLDAEGGLDRIVEAKEASPVELDITLCNSGVMAADATTLFRLLAKVGNDNAKGEYYLTDCVALTRDAGLSARAVIGDQDEFLGVNGRAELAAAEAAFQSRRRAALMEAGVTMTAPETVFVSYDTELAADVTVEPHVVFGPGVSAESGATIRAFSHLEGSRVGQGAIVGPYARLRPGAELGSGSKVGNFVEIKKATLGDGAKVNHLSYVGDAQIGAGANIGAGVITCNYDGFDKHLTVIGEGAFIGSNSALVAPVTVEAGAYVGSGSVITKTVEENALAVARGKQINRPGWATAYRNKKQGDKT